jgi:mannonate dehydratase
MAGSIFTVVSDLTMMLRHSWRWFGPADPVSLKDVGQTGARAVVTALHHIPVGEIWEIPMIRERQSLIREAGLEWSVVESVPVHEDIKTRTGNYQAYIDNYKQTIQNLGECRVPVLCYNFMPVLDWSRTDLNFKFSDGSESLYFDSTIFAVIDIYILQRNGAEESYPEEVLSRAKEIYQKMDAKRLADLERTFLLGLPGSGETFTLEQVRQRIDRYSDISRETFKSNLR